MNQSKPYVKKYLGYNVRLDLIHDNPKKSIRAGVSAVRDWAMSAGYSLTLDEAAHQLFLNKQSYEAQYGVRAGSKPVTEAGQRFYVMVSVPKLLVLTYTFKRVRWEVTQALQNGVQVMVYSPYKVPSKYLLTNVMQWETLCDQEANPEWAKWMKELDINLDYALDTETPWLAFDSLRMLMSQFSSFNLFLDYLHAEIAEIEAEGVWDVDTAGSEVFNEKASVSHYVASSGMDKGRRSCYSEYKYATKKRFRYTYEMLPIDVMTKYLHLTYLHDVDYKPMARIMNDGVEYGTRQYFEFLSEQEAEDGQFEQGLTVTPVYQDPYAHSAHTFDCDKFWVSESKLMSDMMALWSDAVYQLLSK